MPTIERASCPLCKAASPRILHALECSSDAFKAFVIHDVGEEVAEEVIFPHFKGANFSYAECRDCGFIWQTTVLDLEGMSDLYSRHEDDVGYDESLKRYQTRSSRQRGTRLAMRVAQTLDVTGEIPPKVKVMDFGCGFGVWLKMAKAMGADCTGVELSEGRRNALNRLGIETHRLLSDVDEQFDLVLSDQVIEHVADPVDEVKQLVAKVKPGGHVFLGTPSSRKAKKVIASNPERNKYNPIRPFIHINSFTNSTLKLIGKQAGLVPICPSSRFGYRLGLGGALVNLLATRWDFMTKSAIHFRKPA